MKVALAIPFWGHDEHRQRNYEYVLTTVGPMYPWDVIFVGANPGSPNRGAARNHLVKMAEDFDVVVLCDADTLPEEETLAAAITAAGGGGLHFAFNRFRALHPAGTSILLDGHDMRQATPWLDSECLGSLGGVMCIRPDEWWKAGGSPEMEGWGFEDVIFAVQARTLLDQDNRWHPGWITHLWHPSEVAIGSPQYNQNLALCKEYEAASGDVVGIRRLLDRRSQ